MAIKSREGVTVSAKVKAKLVLKDYIDKFDLEKDCFDFSEFKGAQAGKVKEQIDKIIERMQKALVIK
jgi:coenzyme F420-reducing hydrogenase delta subunit